VGGCGNDCDVNNEKSENRERDQRRRSVSSTPTHICVSLPQSKCSSLQEYSISSIELTFTNMSPDADKREALSSITKVRYSSPYLF
jgi:hypothetical protein